MKFLKLLLIVYASSFGAKISELTPTIDPDGLEVAGARLGANYKIDLGAAVLSSYSSLGLGWLPYYNGSELEESFFKVIAGKTIHSGDTLDVFNTLRVQGHFFSEYITDTSGGNTVINNALDVVGPITSTLLTSNLITDDGVDVTFGGPVYLFHDPVGLLEPVTLNYFNNNLPTGTNLQTVTDNGATTSNDITLNADLNISGVIESTNNLDIYNGAGTILLHKNGKSDGTGGFSIYYDAAGATQSVIRGYQTNGTQADFRLGGVAVGKDTVDTGFDFDVLGRTQIGSLDAESHLNFYRDGYNYVTTRTSGGKISFIPGGEPIAATNSALTIELRTDSIYTYIPNYLQVKEIATFDDDVNVGGSVEISSLSGTGTRNVSATPTGDLVISNPISFETLDAVTDNGSTTTNTITVGGVVIGAAGIGINGNILPASDDTHEIGGANRWATVIAKEVRAEEIRMNSPVVPSSSTDTGGGPEGTIAFDVNYFYVRVNDGLNEWKRVPLSTF